MSQLLTRLSMALIPVLILPRAIGHFTVTLLISFLRASSLVLHLLYFSSASLAVGSLVIAAISFLTLSMSAITAFLSSADIAFT